MELAERKGKKSLVIKVPEASTAVFIMIKLFKLAPEYFSEHNNNEHALFYDKGYLTEAEVVLGLLQCIHVSALIGDEFRIKHITHDVFSGSNNNRSRIRIRNRGPDMRLYFVDDAQKDWVNHIRPLEDDSKGLLLENVVALTNKFMVLLRNRGIDLFHVAAIISNCVTVDASVECTINNLAQDLFYYMSPYDPNGHIRNKCHELRYKIIERLQLHAAATAGGFF